MFAHLFGRRRPREQIEAEDATAATAQPPIKKRKTATGAATGNTNNDRPESLADMVKEHTDVWTTVTTFLEDEAERSLAACAFDFYEYFADRDSFTFVKIERHSESCIESAVEAKATELIQRDKLASQRTWSSLLMWWRPRPPPRTLQPWRYFLQHRYKVPLVVARGLPPGPSCVSTPMDGSKEYLHLLIGGALDKGGLLVQVDPDKSFERDGERVLNIVRVTHTCPAAGGGLLSFGYSFVLDKLWWCSSSSQGKEGHLVLKHGSFRETRMDTIDLSRPEDQDIELDNGTVHKGVKRVPFPPLQDGSEDATLKVIVSSREGVVYLIRLAEGATSIVIENFYASSGIRIASALHQVLGADALPRRPVINAVVSQDKLVLVLNLEEQIANARTDGNGLGVYVFDSHDLTLFNYTPSEFAQDNTLVEKMTADCVLFRVWRGNDSYQATLGIRGGIVGPPKRLNCGVRGAVLLVTDTNQLYTYEDESEGTIQIHQFDLLSGNMIRTLDTGVPWRVEDDEHDVIHRMMAGAHVVGNKLVFLITSVGSHVNSIVTFAKPSSLSLTK